MLGRQVELNPTDGLRHISPGTVQAVRGDSMAAEQELRLGERLSGLDGPPLNRSFLVYAYGRIGLHEDARRVFDEVDALSPNPLTENPGFTLYAHLGVGDVDGALELAARAAEMSTSLPGTLGRPLLAFNPLRDPVLERAEFVALRDRIRRN